jgi:diadenosine tetraphosphate (Ap4A) HIT family hydrolase
MNFELHTNLACKAFIIDLPLCRVLLEDEQNYPWIFLVPRRPHVSRIMDLLAQDQLQLMIELDWAQKILWEQFQPTHLNVAALGNKTPQLHIHVIARSSQDPAWPGAIWDHPIRSFYSIEQKNQVVSSLTEAFNHKQDERDRTG